MELTTHRLDGLEPDNLLAFLALLGLLRVLAEAKPQWCPRVSWTLDDPPLRPALRVSGGADDAAVAEAAAEGLEVLAKRHEFGGLANLTLSQKEAARKLRRAAEAAGNDRYMAELWSALVSDAVMARDGKKVEPTPLCLLKGQGHQHFLKRLASVPQQNTPLKRGKIAVSETDCLLETLFESWKRPDATDSFRWDPHEDVRYALRARDPTDASTKETTQHGANRLAAIGLSTLTVVPKYRANDVKLRIIGGDRDAKGSFVFRWPIWQEPISLAGIRALLSHPSLWKRDALASLGVVEVRQTRRILTGRYMNFTWAEAELDQADE